MENTKVCAYYFPNWHVDPRNEKWHGTGWTEWDVVKYATPRFEGHVQPKVPLWGYEDESDPKVMAKKIDAALNHGVDSFIFDWYWFSDGSYRIKCIDEGFLKAENFEKIEFAIMWANHDPIQAHPTSRMFRNQVLQSGDISPETLKEATDYCIKHYFDKPNYMKIDGKLFFSFFKLPKLIRGLGGTENAKKELENFRQRVRDAGLGELHINIVDGSLLELEGTEDENETYNIINKTAEYVGIDSWCSYGYPGISGSFPGVDYKNWIDTIPAIYEERSREYKLPYNPNVIMGWDVSPRTVQSEKYENIGYPYTPILVNNTPENFEQALKYARDFAASDKFTGDIITINAWNEWTEGSYLEPDEEFGYGYLEAIKNTFKK